MGDAYAAAERLVEDRPDVAEGLEAVLDRDREGPWGFDDVPLDSGDFGELVSRDFVEETANGYRLREPETVAAAVAGDPRPASGAEGMGRPGRPSLPHPGTVDAVLATLLAVAFGAVVVTRAYIYDVVFRRGDVVLLSNDPYFYRTLVEQYPALGGTPRVRNGEPLLVWTLRQAATAVGDVGAVLAWYPVVAGLASAAGVYLLARRLDGRVAGLAAVGFLAVLPAHAFRTALGFADHHAFDLLWLALTLVALAAVLDRDRPRRWPWVGALAVGVAGQVLAWEGSPVLLVPLGIAVAGAALLDVEDARDPLPARAPVVLALAVAATFVALLHAVAGWQAPELVVAVGGLAVGAAGVVAVATVGHRIGRGAAAVAGTMATMGAVAVVAIAVLAPALAGRLAGRAARLGVDSDAVEASTGLFGLNPTEFWMPLVLFGFALVVGLAALPRAVYRARRDATALVVAVYAVWFLAVAVVQARFAAPLSLPVAALAGAGFVGFARRVDLVEDGALVDRRLALAVFLVLASLGGAQTALKIDQVTHDPALHDAARWAAADAGDAGEPPYVFSGWGVNRMLNYFVGGDALSYRFARRHFTNFTRSPEPGDWYGRLDRQGTAYVVIRDRDVPPEAGTGTVARMLHDRWGGAEARATADGAAGSGRFQLAWHRDGVQVFRVVPGARLVWNGTAAATTAADVTVDGSTRTYRRSVPPNGSVRLAYPGRYRVGDVTREVTAADVHEGRRVVVP